MKFRQERDSLGTLNVPVDALYQAQTQRAVENFPISGLRMPEAFISALALIKYCAAHVNCQLGLLETPIAAAIERAALDVRDGKHRGQFPVDVFQTGSGTSTNMNINEVLASLATRALGTAEAVSPNDHVNLGQSSNDVIPTAIQLSAAIALNEKLLPALATLGAAIAAKGRELSGVVKTGRTHLMDAMPLTMEQELSGWGAQIGDHIARLESTLPRLYALPQGGTAVGTGVNTHPQFGEKIAAQLSAMTALPLRPAENFFAVISSQDTAVELSGQLRTIAVGLMKISNDLRWMNSGPLAGLGEIELEALQPGSSIMPGKVNPVVPEAVAMAAAQVMGNDAAIAIAGQSGNFQLNVMLPLIAYNLLQSIHLLSTASRLLADKAIGGFKVRQDNLDKALARNPILATALNPRLGYLRSAEIAKEAYRQKRPIIDVAEEMCEISRAELETLLDPKNLLAPRGD